jgi:hypothetical protein
MLGPFYNDIYLTYVSTKDKEWNNANGSSPNPGGAVTGTYKRYSTIIYGCTLTYKF